MPSKSKAQAHLMAAAAHNPEIAKDAGIPQSVAKDFNQADKKDGTLKKGSNKPEHVKEDVINEASGVGIMNVPPTLLKQIQRQVGSVLLTMGLSRQKELSSQGYDEQAKALNTYLKRFQNKYNASVLSPADLKKYVNSINNVHVDKDALFNELPKSLQNREGVKQSLENITIRLLLSNQESGIYGSSHESPSGNQNVQTIAIPSYRHDFQDRSAETVANTMTRVMGTVQHELQHAIQSAVLGRFNAKDSQVEQKPGYGDHGDAYYASGVEFGTQVKDLANHAINWLNMNPDELTGSKTKDVSNAIKYALGTYKGTIIQALRKYKHDDRANKAMKLIYREVSKFYDEDFADQSDSGELDTTEKDAFHDTDNNYRMLQYPEAGDSPIGDLWLSINRYFNEKPTVYGNYDDIHEMVFKRDFGEIIFTPAQNGGVYMSVRIDGDRDKNFGLELTPKEAKEMIGDVGYFTNYQTLTKLRNKMEEERIPNADLGNADYIINDTNETESMFNNDPNKSIQTEYDEDEGTVYVYIQGAREKMYIQVGGKEYWIGYGSEMTRCSQKDFPKIIEEIFKFYYDADTTPRMFSKFMRDISRTSILVPKDIETEIEYIKQLQSSKEEEVTESSMRGWADVVQNAELEHNIDDADEQELIHKGQLEEMPQRFDAFAGQDPDSFVDRTAKMNNQANMVPVADHGNFKVLKSKNGTGYIAYDQNNKPIAIVSGYSNGGVFHEEAIASKSNNKGVVYQIYMDMLNDGQQILSDTLHSDDAIRFWQKLISNHEVYIVGDGKVLAKATPEKFHKYWGDEGSPSAELQLLLVK